MKMVLTLLEVVLSESEDFDWSKYFGLRHKPLNDELLLCDIILSNFRIGYVGRNLVQSILALIVT